MTRRNVSGPRSPGPRHAYLVHVGQDEPGRREGGGSHADIGRHRDDGDGYVNGEHSIQPWRALVPRPKHASITWLDPTAGLADGDVDAALLRLPFPGQDTLRTMVLFTEARWVALPAAHLAPESAARYYARPGVTYRPVAGASPSQVGVAWPPAADANAVVQDVVRCCRDHRPTP